MSLLATSSLNDHIVTNSPEKNAHSGGIHTSISDHSLVLKYEKYESLKKMRKTL